MTIPPLTDEEFAAALKRTTRAELAHASGLSHATLHMAAKKGLRAVNEESRRKLARGVRAVLNGPGTQMAPVSEEPGEPGPLRLLDLIESEVSERESGGELGALRLLQGVLALAVAEAEARERARKAEGALEAIRTYYRRGGRHG